MDSDKNSLRKLAAGFAAVTEVFVYSLAGFTAGYFLDRWIQRTKPWLTVVMTFVGMVGGFVKLYRWYVQEEEKK